MRPLFFLILVIMAAIPPLAAQVCTSWSTPKRVGQLSGKYIPESSGLEISASFPNRFYHINDSGGGPYFYITQRDGSKTKKIKIENYNPKDTEDISIGPCLGNDSCLFIGDIGNNAKKRRALRIAIIPEQSKFPSTVKALNIVKARYPDRPHNAEGMAVHPNGDLFIFTKERMFGFFARSTRVYRLDRQQLQSHTTETMTYLGKFRLPKLMKGYKSGGKIVTSFDIHPDGKKLTLLTYQAAIELNIDLSLGDIPYYKEMQVDIDYKIIPLKVLPQQEAIAYDPFEHSLYYTTESNDGRKRGSPIYRLNCNE